MTEIGYDVPGCEPKEVAWVLDFVSQLHGALTQQQLSSPERLNAVYQRVVSPLNRKHKISLSKAQINKVYQALVQAGRLPPSFIVDSVTKSKSVRSRSGVLPISVATDGNNFSCAFDCHFCPDESVENGAPKTMSRSYLSSEGTFIRGAVEDFDAARQVWRRLLELEVMGHPPDKCEMIVLGGTWDSYDKAYRDEFVHGLFYACNVFHRFSLRMRGDLSHLTQQWLATDPWTKGLAFDPDRLIISQLRKRNPLQEEKAENQSSRCARIIGIVLETRPDQISKPSLLRKRRLGCTRVQLGLQHIDNEILELNNRAHGVEESVRALRYARDACFKVDGHLMPDLPGTTIEKDREMLDRVFLGDDLQLDYCKLYPCLDLPYTVTRKWKEEGFWKPLAEHSFPEFLDLLRYALAIVPPWVRINRVQRDFPEATEKNEYLGFVSDNIRSNLQQMVHQELAKHRQACYDIRTREIKNAFPPDVAERARLFVRCYRANQGTEFFISVEIPHDDGTEEAVPMSARQRKRQQHKPKVLPPPPSPDNATLMGLLRLRFSDHALSLLGSEPAKAPAHLLPEFAKEPMALVRELHVYGSLRMVAGGAEPTTPTAGDDAAAVAAEQRKQGLTVPEHLQSQAQHTGVGKFLMATAERLSCLYGFNKVAVISGVGVRDYYTRLGYILDEREGEYMIKDISKAESLLPYQLFGNAVRNDELCVPVAALKIPRAQLPAPRWERLPGCTSSCVALGTHNPLYPRLALTHVYERVQEGRAQLVVVQPAAIVGSGGTGRWLVPLAVVLSVLVALLAVLWPLVAPQQ
eukprot:m.71303 g.71303  ORF g.71303 m.71303 type:complete len:806 (+) comp14156_c0_seq2:172-2589(+)